MVEFPRLENILQNRTVCDLYSGILRELLFVCAFCFSHGAVITTLAGNNSQLLDEGNANIRQRDSGPLVVPTRGAGSDQMALLRLSRLDCHDSSRFLSNSVGLCVISCTYMFVIEERESTRAAATFKQVMTAHNVRRAFIRTKFTMNVSEHYDG